VYACHLGVRLPSRYTPAHVYHLGVRLPSRYYTPVVLLLQSRLGRDLLPMDPSNRIILVTQSLSRHRGEGARYRRVDLVILGDSKMSCMCVDRESGSYYVKVGWMEM
jgi:hypothetical protein